MALKDVVRSSNNDAVSAVEKAEKSRGDSGVPWVGGSNAGCGSQRWGGPVSVRGMCYVG